MSTGSPVFGVRAHAIERAHIVAPRGDLDLYTVEEARAAIAIRPDVCDTVVLDLRGLSFFDTSGMHLVVETAHALARAGVRFAIVRGAPQVQRLFTIARLDEQLPFFDDLDAALAA